MLKLVVTCRYRKLPPLLKYNPDQKAERENRRKQRELSKIINEIPTLAGQDAGVPILEATQPDPSTRKWDDIDVETTNEIQETS